MIDEITIPEHWCELKELGEGTFSIVYSAYDDMQKAPIAVKVAKDEASGKLLEREAEILRFLKNCKSKFHTGTPQLIDFSQPRSYIAMERLGKTLLNLHTELKQMSLKTVLMIAVEAISALEEIHTCGVVHRDVKPDNIAVGLSEDDSRIYMIDMGLSCRYLYNGSHVAYSEDSYFQGTPYFCSINTLRGVTPTRRDDLEALGYVLIFLCSGSLPWLENCTFDTLYDMLVFREKYPARCLCSHIDEEFAIYLNKCQNYSFNEKPNYQELRDLFTTLAAKKCIQLDGDYDWLSPLKPVRPHRSQTMNLDIDAKRPRRLSKRMKVLEIETQFPHPSHLLEGMRRASEPNGWSLDDTPVHRIDQLPCLNRRPRVGEAQKKPFADFI